MALSPTSRHHVSPRRPLCVTQGHPCHGTPTHLHVNGRPLDQAPHRSRSLSACSCHLQPACLRQDAQDAAWEARVKRNKRDPKKPDFWILLVFYSSFDPCLPGRGHLCGLGGASKHVSLRGFRPSSFKDLTYCIAGRFGNVFCQ